MKVQYRSNLSAGVFSLILAVILFVLIPSQIGVDTQAVHGISSRSLPYGLSALMGVCGIGLLFQSLVLKKDKVKELNLKNEGKGALYMICLLAYGIGFNYSFLISTSLLGIITLAFTRCKKVAYYVIVVAVVTVLYFTFTQLLHVRLP